MSAKTETAIARIETRLLTEKTRLRIEKTLRTSGIRADLFIPAVISALKTDPNLALCSLGSLFSAIIQCAEAGLIPNGFFGHAYLIPYKKEAKFQIGYKGLIELAMRSGKINGIYAQTVYNKEEFYVEYGTEKKLIHKPIMTENRGDVIAFYCVTFFSNGWADSCVMTKEDVDNVKKSAQSQNVWNKHYVEMGKKTVIKRYLKTAALSPQTVKASNLDTLGEMGLDTKIFCDDFIDVESEDVVDNEPKGIADKTAAKTAEMAEKTAKVKRKAEERNGEPPKTDPAVKLWNAMLELCGGDKADTLKWLSDMSGSSDISKLSEADAKVLFETKVKPELDKQRREME